jgi:hypothetical protein
MISSPKWAYLNEHVNIVLHNGFWEKEQMGLDISLIEAKWWPLYGLSLVKEDEKQLRMGMVHQTGTSGSSLV